MKPTKLSKARQSVYDEEGKLIEALSDYLLTESNGRMKTLVTHLTIAHRDKSTQQQVRLVGDTGFFFHLIKELLESWGIEVVNDKTLELPPTVHDLYIPPIHERRNDLPKIISCFVSEHLQKIRRSNRDPARIPNTISGRLVWLLEEHRWSGFDVIQQFCKQSINRAVCDTIEFATAIEDSSPLVEAPFKESGSDNPEFNAFLESYDPMETKLVNRVSLFLEAGATKIVSQYLRNSSIPFNFKENIFPLVAIKQVIDNIQFLRNLDTSRWADKEKSRFESCLKLRCEGESEEDITKILGFSKPETYQSWVEKLHINLEFPTADTVYDDWLGAKLELGISETTTDASRSRFLSIETFREVSFDGEFLLPTYPQALFMKTIHNSPKDEVTWEYIKLRESTLKNYGSPNKIFKNGQDGKTLWKKAICYPSRGRKALYSFRYKPTIVTSFD